MATDTTTHRIVVLGAGYTGMMAAVRAARRTRKRGGEVILVNPSTRFTERLRMHQIATGQDLTDYQIPDLLADTGVQFVQGWASSIDPEHQTVALATPSGGERVLEYDYLVYAIGSTTSTVDVPGVDAHAYTLNGPGAAVKLATRLGSMAPGERVTVVGNGLTGIESAAEIAESHPDLRVSLLGFGEPGSMMGPKARAYLLDALDRLQIEVRSGVLATKVLPDAVELESGELVESDATLWTTGFWASPLAAESGIAVDARRRIVVDATLRSLSHPRVFAIGDAAAIHLAWGEIHGTCQSGIPSGAHAADTIARLIKGRKPKPFRFGYWHQPVSLGRGDAVIQFTKRDDKPRRLYLKGKKAIRYKEVVTSSPPATYRLSRRFNIPKAMLSLKGGHTTRRAPADTVPVAEQPA